jgi:hypothetical protein
MKRKEYRKCSERVKVLGSLLTESRHLVKDGRIFQNDIAREQPN